jgi:hypothetical protein
VIDVGAARDHLRATLDEPVEIKDPNVLDAAAAVFAASPQSEGPRSPLRGPSATSERTTADASYPDHQTRAI